MTTQQSPDIGNVDDLIAHAYEMEREAAERYRELADQMREHNNPTVADLFAKMADIEANHANQIVDRSGDTSIPHRAPWSYSWLDPEGPETTMLEDIDYLLTPRQALRLARHNEERALKFYETIAAEADSGPLKQLAFDFAEEERAHVRLMDAWLDKYPATTEVPRDDWDASVPQ